MEDDSPSPLKQYYNELTEVVQIYSNVESILEKIHSDNNLKLLVNTFQIIIENELQYTVEGRIIRTQKTQKRQSSVGIQRSVL